MKRVLIFSLALTFFFSCNNTSSEYRKAEDAEEAGREFIRASLDGDYKKASFFLYKDSTNSNLTLLDIWKAKYNGLSEEDKVSYKSASITALNIQPENDSTVNYTFTNSFKSKDTTTLKIVRIKNEWLVDFKALH
jgi:hypothetical protein